uniref:Uncharacterized protein n=1 Tax=Chromera velia CCMP2878 TaxID=1169474 RepID=A0A0G4I6I0_9ALVE|eukprot:Cvel_1882.t1-p1 / transcript=Cvel_1882.t1 / gene=Cvel_1882 / organism=Chromera_velia_CCMP2878 / gene_product=hypothetical protein / transcript_product=hypothetical protein / location=Cvel_scaffold70:81877-86097(-) / protein_length=460 / sequence_SO=supercontig / SO=protein_coding / is_pseudo=false
MEGEKTTSEIYGSFYRFVKPTGLQDVDPHSPSLHPTGGGIGVSGSSGDKGGSLDLRLLSRDLVNAVLRALGGGLIDGFEDDCEASCPDDVLCQGLQTDSEREREPREGAGGGGAGQQTDSVRDRDRAELFSIRQDMQRAFRQRLLEMLEMRKSTFEEAFRKSAAERRAEAEREYVLWSQKTEMQRRLKKKMDKERTRQAKKEQDRLQRERREGIEGRLLSDPRYANDPSFKSFATNVVDRGRKEARKKQQEKQRAEKEREKSYLRQVAPIGDEYPSQYQRWWAKTRPANALRTHSPEQLEQFARQRAEKAAVMRSELEKEREREREKQGMGGYGRMRQGTVEGAVSVSGVAARTEGVTPQVGDAGVLLSGVPGQSSSSAIAGTHHSSSSAMPLQDSILTTTHVPLQTLTGAPSPALRFSHPPNGQVTQAGEGAPNEAEGGGTENPLTAVPEGVEGGRESG